MNSEHYLFFNKFESTKNWWRFLFCSVLWSRIRFRIKVEKSDLDRIKTSVADPGCLSRIPDPTFSIPDPGSELSPSYRIRIKEFKYFNPQKTKKMVSKLWKIWSGLFIPDPVSGCWLSTHPGSRIQGSKRHRIPDPDPEHWSIHYGSGTQTLFHNGSWKKSKDASIIGGGVA